MYLQGMGLGVGGITESGESFGERRGTSSNVENFVPATQSVKGARSGRQPSPPGCLVSHGFETAGGRLPRSCVLQAYTDQRFAIVSHGCFL
jgi:hypothetical protein